MSASAQPPADHKIPGALPPEKYSTERVTRIDAINDHLFRFRTTRHRAFRFAPGQFARLGIFRDDGAAGPRYIWRAYSIASANYEEHLEFYSIVVPDGEFTVKLAQLRVGDPLLIEKTSYGFLTTARFVGGKDLWLLSSGTGLAPFISILCDPEVWNQYEKIVVVHSVRSADELAYRQEIAALPAGLPLDESCPRSRLIYVPIVTRDQSAGMLSDRIPTAIANGRLEAAAGTVFDQARSRVMICGNPEMVDDVRRALQLRGLSVSRQKQPGNIAVENYW